jgi:hypothetical protein
MPDFSTEIDIYVDEFWNECSRSEKNELIDLLVEEGHVTRVPNSSIDDEKQKPSLIEIEWNDMIDKLSLLRQRLSIEEEETIKALVEKYS